MKKLTELIVLFFSGFAIWLVLSLFFAWIASIIYNLVIPDMFGLPPTDYWHMFGLIVLIKTVFPNNPSQLNKNK